MRLLRVCDRQYPAVTHMYVVSHLLAAVLQPDLPLLALEEALPQAAPVDAAPPAARGMAAARE